MLRTRPPRSQRPKAPRARAVSFGVRFFAAAHGSRDRVAGYWDTATLSQRDCPTDARVRVSILFRALERFLNGPAIIPRLSWYT